MAQTFATNFADLAGVRPIGEGQYESISHPERMGNNANIAYGGCTAAVAFMAAHESVPPTYRFYSAVGSYLAPALTDRKLLCSVKSIRKTITFATRLVEVSQVLESGERRAVMLTIVDFQAPETATLLEYSVKPSFSCDSVDSLLTMVEKREEMVEQKLITPKLAQLHAVVFGLLLRHVDVRLHPDGILSQNLYGMAKYITTTQDDRDLPSKVSAEYYKMKQAPKSQAQNIAALGFLLDGGLSFIPLAHNHQFLDDAGATATLDFAMRVFSNDVDLSKWHLRQANAIVGTHGRSYSEGRLWDDKGSLIASMTQQTILRPPKKPSVKASL
jgi:acyl-CoA thioesterase II